MMVQGSHTAGPGCRSARPVEQSGSSFLNPNRAHQVERSQPSRLGEGEYPARDTGSGDGSVQAPLLTGRHMDRAPTTRLFDRRAALAGMSGHNLDKRRQSMGLVERIKSATLALTEAAKRSTTADDLGAEETEDVEVCVPGCLPSMETANAA